MQSPTAPQSVVVTISPTGSAAAAAAKDATAPAAAASAASATPVKFGRESSLCHRRYVILSIVSVGALLASIQSSALIIAFAVLMEELKCTLMTLLWVILAYMLVITATVGSIGNFADAFGKSFLFKIGFTTFVVASFLAGFSQASNEGYDLVAYRVLMGLGAAILFTNSMSIIADEFIPFGEMGIAQGVFGLFFSLGMVLGPVVGGVLAEADWRWVFFINVPPGGLACMASYYYMADPPVAAGAPPRGFARLKGFDYVGVFFNAAGITLGLIALTQMVIPDPNVNNAGGLSGVILVAAACFACFFIDQVKVARPILPLGVFNDRIFSSATIASTVVSFARGNVVNVMIFFLQGPYKQSPMDAGIMMIPFGVGVLMTSYYAGVVADKTGLHAVWAGGCVLSAAASVGMGFIGPHSNYWLLALVLFLIGLGFGLFNTPNSVGGFVSVKPEHRGVAAGVKMMTSMVAAMLGIVMVFGLMLTSLPFDLMLDLFVFGITLTDAQLHPFMDSYQTLCWTIAAAFFAGAPLVAFVPLKKKQPQPAAAANGGKPMAAAALPRAPSTDSDSPNHHGGGGGKVVGGAEPAAESDGLVDQFARTSSATAATGDIELGRQNSAGEEARAVEQLARTVS